MVEKKYKNSHPLKWQKHHTVKIKSVKLIDDRLTNNSGMPCNRPPNVYLFGLLLDVQFGLINATN